MFSPCSLSWQKKKKNNLCLWAGRLSRHHPLTALYLCYPEQDVKHIREGLMHSSLLWVAFCEMVQGLEGLRVLMGCAKCLMFTFPKQRPQSLAWLHEWGSAPSSEHPPNTRADTRASARTSWNRKDRKESPTSLPPRCFAVSQFLAFVSNAAQSGVPCVQSTGLRMLHGRQKPLLHEEEV